jgi:hypothetical protein
MKVAKLVMALAMFSPLTWAGECEVTVVWGDGGKASGVKVVGKVMEGMTPSEYTNSDGKAVLRWSDSYSVKTIYVDGDDSGVSCPDGGSVTIRK